MSLICIQVFDANNDNALICIQVFEANNDNVIDVYSGVWS